MPAHRQKTIVITSASITAIGMVVAAVLTACTPVINNVIDHAWGPKHVIENLQDTSNIHTATTVTAVTNAPALPPKDLQDLPY